METRLRESEASVVALQEAHAVDVAQAEESLSELRGENRLLTADVESLVSTHAITTSRCSGDR